MQGSVDFDSGARIVGKVRRTLMQVGAIVARTLTLCISSGEAHKPVWESEVRLKVEGCQVGLVT